jgi:hypothetical protein
MITNTGKNIIAKFLIGQAPAYASYMAFGCGEKPLGTSSQYGDYSNRENLTFEMLRVPITSRGYVVEDDVQKIVFTAELPTEERYEVTEVGVFSAKADPALTSTDSRTLVSFSSTENWEYHTDTLSTSIYAASGPLHEDSNNIIVVKNGDVVQKVFTANADNVTFQNSLRVNRHERPRFLNNTIFLSGDLSSIDEDFDTTDNSDHIHLTGRSFNLSKNSPLDELRLAFSVINKSAASTDVPDAVRIIVEFATSDSASTGDRAKFQIEVTNGFGIGRQDLSANRYVVAKAKLEELAKSSSFNWQDVAVIKIFATVINGGVPSPDYLIGIDALRLENTTSTNPLYGMTGYSVIKTDDALPVIKGLNTSNMAEFRFGMDVQ